MLNLLISLQRSNNLHGEDDKARCFVNDIYKVITISILIKIDTTISFNLLFVEFSL